ncbi:plexin-B2-like [Styela clava]
MDLFYRRLFVWIILVTIWNIQSCVGDLPTRKYDEYIAGNDAKLGLTNDSLCVNYSDETGIEFQRLVINDSSLYIGATNYIVQVDLGEFSISNFVSLGPHQDDPDCLAPSICGTACGSRRCTDNRNKLLIPHRNQLIACGSIYAGTCDILDLNNVSQPYIPKPDRERLKCNGDASQITRSSNDLAIADIYTSGSDANKDLFFVGNKDSVDTLYPPDSGSIAKDLEFTRIDQSNIYDPANGVKRTFIKTWVTRTHNFMLWTYQGNEPKSYISRLCHATLNEFSRSRVRTDGSGIGYGQTSYTKTAIECEGYQEATLAFYRHGRLYVLMTKDNRYILCSALSAAISKHMEKARAACFNGLVEKAELIGGACTKITIQPSMVECGLDQEKSDFLNPIQSKEAIQLRKEFVWPRGTDAPTTIAVDLFDGASIGFFGTKTGEILKARIGNSASIFAERIVLDENKPVLYDTGFDKSSNFIYAMSPNKLFKVKLSNCDQYDTCDTCITSNDPYCGWCVLKSSCTHKYECTDSHRSKNWLNTLRIPSECPSVAAIAPAALSVAVSQELTLTFGGSELPDHDYECEFVVGDTAIHTAPMKNFSSTPTCYSPPEPPMIPDGKDNVNVTLHIKAGNATVASGNLNIYDCNKIPSINKNTMCASCVTSSWSCTWCSNSNTCADYCVNSVGISGKGECPAVLEVKNLTVDIPVGKPQEFTLVTTNLPKAQDFECVLDVCESRYEVIVPGIRDGEEVKCNVSENQLNCEKEDATVILSLKSGRYIVDTPRVATVTIDLFNCSSSEGECGLCIISHARHSECAWCGDSSTCIPSTDCKGPKTTDITSCPAPVIEWINPTNGPKNGGTEITISGKNLGSKSSEISNITVGETVNCKVLPEKYVPSKKIVCETGSTSLAPSSGPVQVYLSYTNNKFASEQNFTFKEVTVTGFEPKYALLGTKVTISGTNLDVGNGASVKIVQNSEERSSICLDRTPTQLVCLVPTAPSTGSYAVWATLDGFTQKMEGNIQFVTEPNVTRLVGRESLVSFYSGGLVATFEMTSLLGIQNVALNVNGGEIEQDCDLNTNTTTISCPIPAMNSLDPEYKTRSKRAVDGDTKQAVPRTTDSKNVPAEIVINNKLKIPLAGSLSLVYVNNPQLDSLTSMPCRTPETTGPDSRTTGGTSVNGTTRSDPQSDATATKEPTVAVQLTGKYLNSAAIKEDYTITIEPLEGDPDSVDCLPSFLEAESLICKAPASALRKYEGYKVQVTVKVGNLTFPLRAEYCPEGGSFGVATIAVIVAVVVVLVIIIVILVVMFRKRAQKQRKEREQIMFMLDTLENKTRENARKAYFELQLGYMTTLTDNLGDIITYLSPVSCFMRALFNDWKPDHPMLNSKSNSKITNGTVAGIDEFIQLLKNKDFLMTLVKTLEEQKHFTVKEKGQFASLLTVCLFDDLVYFTKVMMDLLSDLIQKHVGKNPKLLLRRSESVVEKMVSHWLCINLYSQCIRDQAGKPLFLLTKAIHFLVNSAPSDVVANKAVNSLNEMTLLGTEITYETITLKASVVDKGKQSEVFEVKVVNCDTITQVKEKIIEVVYRDRPFSENPTPGDMELELVAGQGHLVLSDIDNMSHEEGTYTQINTLKHYNVPDGAVVLLTPTKTDTEGASENGNPPAATRKRRLYHLIHPRDKEPNGFIEEDDSGNKTKALIGNLINQPFQEIYLTRMVKSKTTVQEYVDGVFNAILNPDPLSKAVKYFFQFLDMEAAKHKINDPEVVHIWKTNSLLLRYWVNILKNPEFLFDVNKTAIVDSCLNVITQAFMDACTTTNHKLGQDSPSNKLLYAKDAERYRKMVAKFFENISNEEVTGEEELNESLRQVSSAYAVEFNKRAAAQQLYNHLDKYRSQVQEAVEDSDNSGVLTNKLNNVIMKLSQDTNGHAYDEIVSIPESSSAPLYSNA